MRRLIEALGDLAGHDIVLARQLRETEAEGSGRAVQAIGLGTGILRAARQGILHMAALCTSPVRSRATVPDRLQTGNRNAGP